MFFFGLLALHRAGIGIEFRRRERFVLRDERCLRDNEFGLERENVFRIDDGDRSEVGLILRLSDFNHLRVDYYDDVDPKDVKQR